MHTRLSAGFTMGLMLWTGAAPRRESLRVTTRAK
jgi:hypothetical protein